MRHMLASNTAKPQVPVPNSQLAKLLKHLQVSKSGITKPVVSVAKQKFLTLGWELCELGSGTGAKVKDSDSQFQSEKHWCHLL